MRVDGIMGDTLSELVEAKAEERARLLMDEETFRAFYARTSRGVWVYLSRITGDRQLADDLLQEAYYRLYRAGRAYESETHRRNALYLIATNVARDAARRKSRAEIVPLPEQDELRGDDRTAMRAERRTDLARAMARLTSTQREMLWLAYAQGASHDEIAEIFGLKSSSIRLLLFRARRRLAALLQRKTP